MNEVLPQEIADRLTDFLCDYSSVKPYLFIQVINQDNHAGELERLIYRSHYELAITCHIDVSHIVGLPATVTVTHEMLDILGIDEEQIIDDALTNAPALRPVKAYAMPDLMRELVGKEIGDETGIPMIILTNEDKRYGAGVVFYPGLLAKISDETGVNLLLIPSSVHEIICIPECEDMDYDDINLLITETNHGFVAENEVLSDRLFRYDRESDEIRPV